MATATALLVAMVVAGVAGLAWAVAAGLVGWAVARWLVARLGGLTGDTYGALNEVTEGVVLALALVFVGGKFIGSQMFGIRTGQALGPALAEIFVGCVLVGLVAVNDAAGLKWLASLAGWTSIAYSCHA